MEIGGWIMLISEESSQRIWEKIAKVLAKKVNDGDSINWQTQFNRFFNIIEDIENSLGIISILEMNKLRQIAGRQVVNDKDNIDWSAFNNVEQNMANLLGKIVGVTLFLRSHNSRKVDAEDRSLAMKDGFTYITNHEDGSYTFNYEKELVAMERYLALTKMAYFRQMNKEEM